MFRQSGGDPTFTPSYKAINSIGKIWRKRGSCRTRNTRRSRELAWDKCVLCMRCYCPVGHQHPVPDRRGARRVQGTGRASAPMTKEERMIKATRKPLEEIFDMVKGYARVLVAGCGGCTSVCLAGGQRETLELAEELAECARHARVPQQYACFVAERQCNREFLDDMAERVENADCLLSLGCGAGAGLMADTYPAVPVFPALNTMFLGADLRRGPVRGELPGLRPVRAR